MNASRAFYVVVSLLLSSCDRSASDSASDSSSAALPDVSVVAEERGDESWFTQTLVRDLNGDDRMDSAVLVVRGEQPDSSDVTLTLFVDGQAAYTEQWSTAYELVIRPDSLSTPELTKQFLRDRLAAVLAGLELRPLDVRSLAVTQPAEALQLRLDSIVPLPQQQLNLTYGYESSLALIWDASRHRFEEIFVCC